MLSLVVGALALHAAPSARLPLRALRARPITACATTWTTASSGLKYSDEAVGEGEEAKKGSQIKIKYSSRVVDGDELDSNTVQFEIGKIDIIPGWAEGISGMKAGGKRTVRLPPELWSGAKTAMQMSIPKDAFLEFDFELVSTYTPTLVERIGTQNLILGSLIVLIGFWELYIVIINQ